MSLELSRFRLGPAEPSEPATEEPHFDIAGTFKGAIKMLAWHGPLSDDNRNSYGVVNVQEMGSEVML